MVYKMYLLLRFTVPEWYNY